MDLDEAIKVVDKACKDPHLGLPEPVFLLLSRLTPLVNVDLLIRDDKGRTLLIWRDDIYHGYGWHIPGGIIRFKETRLERVAAVAKIELGCEVYCEDQPIAVMEHITGKRRERAHAVSFLYRCQLVTEPLLRLKYRSGDPQPGLYEYFDKAPENLLPVHDMYRDYINGKQEGKNV